MAIKQEPMTDTRLDTFYPLLHAMLRGITSTPEGTIQETARARDVMRWITDHSLQISKVLDPVEFKLIKHVLDHYRDYVAAPTRITLEEMVRKDEFPEMQLEYLTLYDQHLPILDTTDAIEIETVFKDRRDAWMKLNFLHVTRISRTISETGIETSDRQIPLLKGVPDAIKYLRGQFDSGAFTIGRTPLGGSMTVLADEVMPLYWKATADRLDGRLTIKTGIDLIDKELGGYDKKTLNLILGHNGHRKSAVARTIAYYAAEKGFRVLFIPLEWSVEEEIAIFSMMHSHHFDEFLNSQSMSIAKFRAGEMTEKEQTFMENYLVSSLKRILGTNLVIRRSQDTSWAGVRSVIEAEYAIEPLDMVVIDYIGAMDCSQARDTTFAMNQAIREMKSMTLHHDDGRGLVIVSPVQGNRKGYEAAKLNGGYWESTDIYMYSEAEKSADTIMYCFMPPEMKAINEMKIGFCKTRRHGTIHPTIVEVDPSVGLVGGSPMVKEARAQEREDRFGPVDPPKRWRNDDFDGIAGS